MFKVFSFYINTLYKSFLHAFICYLAELHVTERTEFLSLNIKYKVIFISPCIIKFNIKFTAIAHFFQRMDFA